MTVPLSKSAIDRLTLVIRLGQRPGTEGELEAARSAIGRIVLANADPILAALSTAPAPNHDQSRALMWRNAAHRMLTEHGQWLSDWERSFCASLASRWREPTPKQPAILERLASRFGFEVIV